MPRPPRRTSWFVTIPLAAGAIGFLALVFFPTAKALRATREEIRTKQDFITQTVGLPTTIAQLEQNLVAAEKFTAAWEARAPSSDQLAKMFGQVNEFVRQTGARAVNFDPQPEVAMALLHRAPVTLEVAGTFGEILGLLAALEEFSAAVLVDGLRITRQQQADGAKVGQDVECELKLEVFAVKSKKSDYVDPADYR